MNIAEMQLGSVLDILSDPGFILYVTAIMVKVPRILEVALCGRELRSEGGRVNTDMNLNILPVLEIGSKS